MNPRTPALYTFEAKFNFDDHTKSMIVESCKCKNLNNATTHIWQFLLYSSWIFIIIKSIFKLRTSVVCKLTISIEPGYRCVGYASQFPADFLLPTLIHLCLII